MNRRWIACVLGSWLAVSAAGARASSLEIDVRHVCGGEPLLLDSLRYGNAAGETFSVTRLSYLLGGFTLERVGGGWVELPGAVAWMDAAGHRTSARLDAVPEGKYRAVRFRVGLDPATNAADPARWPAGHPLNPAVNGLHWGWQGGYVFLALEGHFRAGPAAGHDGGYAYHLAREPFRAVVEVAAPLDLTRHDAALIVDFDLASLLAAPRAVSFARDGTATHARDGDPVAAALAANLAGAFRLRQVVSAAPEISLPSVVRPLYLPATFTPYRLNINRTFPIPSLPRDNPLTEERVALGKELFRATALSRDGSVSCASCHQDEAGSADPRRFSAGVGGRTGARHAMPLTNLAWKTSYFWDGRAASLRAQALVPIQEHAEMDETLARVTEKLSADARYPAMFQAAFGAREITAEKLGLALENYLLTLTAGDAKYDRVLRGREEFTDEERRGFELFMTEYEPRTGQRGADCFHCHGGALFSDGQFHNNGLAAVAGGEEDPGRARVTGSEADRGKFATPGLRNVARRAPYMHDGRFATLEEVVAHYDHGVARGGTLDPNLAKHPEGGLRLNAEDQGALVAFLRTLSEEPAR